jgi:aldose 1-epimerase
MPIRRAGEELQGLSAGPGAGMLLHLSRAGGPLLRAGFLLGLLAASVAGLRPAAGAEKGKAHMEKVPFGQLPDGTPIDQYILDNGRGMVVKVIPYGGILTAIEVPDRQGRRTNVTLGFEDLTGYLQKHPYFGALVGRVANRIAGGRFTLDGQEYVLARNNGPNHLHGGLKGFDKVLWRLQPLPPGEEVGVQLSYRSPDGEEGYPGNLAVTVTYTLTPQQELRLDYRATTDKATPVNLSNHTYFNLAGPAAGDVLGHEVFLAADFYTPTDENLIPTGEIRSVRGTPYDFTQPRTIGSRIGQLPGPPGGYDVNYVLRHPGPELHLAARVYEPTSGRVLEMYTTEPGVQFYTGNFLDGSLRGAGGVVYRKHQGFCLEAQHFPDAVHHPHFPSIILRPGQTYRQTTIYKFATR